MQCFVKIKTERLIVCVHSYLCVLLVVVCSCAVLWSCGAVSVSLCCLVLLVPLLHGVLWHTHTHIR